MQGNTGTTVNKSEPRFPLMFTHTPLRCRMDSNEHASVCCFVSFKGPVCRTLEAGLPAEIEYDRHDYVFIITT